MSSYTDRREQILVELGPEDRAAFDEAYATAGLAMELAETAYRAREVAGLTQAELARKMGTTQSAIARIDPAPAPRLSNCSNASPAPAGSDSPSVSTPPDQQSGIGIRSHSSVLSPVAGGPASNLR